MLILLAILLIIVIVVCIRTSIKKDELKGKSYYDESTNPEDWVVIACVVLLFFIFIAIIFNICDVVNSKYIDEKIMMYEEENTEIENDINTLVMNYMIYEGETYSKFKTEGTDSISMIQLYPDLKSDTLVQQQIQIYTKNNEKIKELKEQQINYKSSKWWLYFGG